jgi:hypothetical protein
LFFDQAHMVDRAVRSSEGDYNATLRTTQRLAQSEA